MLKTKPPKSPKPLKNIRSSNLLNRTTSPIKKPTANPQLSSFKNPNIPRKFPHQNPVRQPESSGPTGRWDESVMNEMGAGGAGGGVTSGMSVGQSSISPISGGQADPTASAVMSKKRYLGNLYKNLFKRKKPV